MTLADLLLAAEQADLETEYRWLVELNTHYSRRVMKARRKEAIAKQVLRAACEHDWFEWQESATYRKRTCNVCGLEEAVDSSG